MEKGSLKSFAVEARLYLIDKIVYKLEKLGITDKGIDRENIKDIGKDVEIFGELYSKEKYNAIIRRYNEIGYNEFVEESVYTWFNRLIALAYMEINGYIDEKMIFNNGTKIEPGIIDNYFEANFFENLNDEEKENLHLLREKNDTEKMYSILIEEKCYELSKIMPFMFGKKGEYFDILFPEGLLSPNSLLIKIREEFEKAVEENREGEKIVPVEIIGWLYQYYNSELKDKVFEGLKKNQKITKEKIAPATQLFTPHWIVKYMAENSLGRLAIENLNIDSNLKNSWKYFIEDENITKSEDEKLNVEDIKIIDPAMGSGHMLTYCFDMLFDIYEDLGWSKKDAVISILKNNLYGLEIDKRAGQLASFSIFMKGREKFSRLFKTFERMEEDEKFIFNTLWIDESNNISEETKNLILENSLKLVNENSMKNLNELLNNFYDAKEYGSILKLKDIDINSLYNELEKLKNIRKNTGQLSLSYNEEVFKNYEKEYKIIEKLILQQKIMTQKYDVVITNPPYMGGKGFDEKLKKYVEKNYKDSKSDLFAVFIEKCGEFTKKDRYTAMITMQSWLFLSSFENLRKNIIEKNQIENLIHLGYGVIGIAFGTTAFILKNKLIENKGNYFRFFDKIAQNIETNDCANLFENSIRKKEFRYNFENYNSINGIDKNTLSDDKGKLIRYQANQKDFEKIPGTPIAYWVSDKIREIFEKNKKLGEVGEAKQGLATANNDRFLRLWNEVDYKKIGFGMENSQEALESRKKWFPYNKGGEFRKWYGNQEYLVNWENDGFEIKNFKNSVIRNPNYYFKNSISWGLITSAGSSFRYYPNGFIYDVGGMSYFVKNNFYNYLGVLNTKIYDTFTKIINPTINLQIGDVISLPAMEIKNINFNSLVEQNISIAKKEWDSRETSWDFEKLSLSEGESLKSSYENYCKYWTENFVQMHKNEEELNKIFIDIYELNDEMDEKIPFEDITFLKKEAKIIEIQTPPQIIEEIETKEKTVEGYLYNRGVKLEFNKNELVKQFLSYAIGCIMGRYSIDKNGLIIANSDDRFIKNENEFFVKDSEGNIRHHVTNPRFFPEDFGIIPIVSENLFENDIVTKIKDFVKALYGEENLSENLDFICEALGKKENENSDDVLRNYFIKDFYSDHLQRYQKRPIYWLMNSGKKNGFSALIYLHRYEENTIPRIRTEYLIPYQEKMENLKRYYESISENIDTSAKDKKMAEKQVKEINTILKELKDYANDVKHISELKISLDLDDGVKINYEKFGKILKKI